MDKHKYSVLANPDVITFLVNNGIYFVFRRGFQSGRLKVFFITSTENAKTLIEFTGWHVNDENDGWDFEGWEVIERK